MYNSIIQDQLKQDIIKLVPNPDSALGMCHHIPHHAVVGQDKSVAKLWTVYDVSARTAGTPSLNDYLQKGPKFNQLIFNILVRF